MRTTTKRFNMANIARRDNRFAHHVSVPPRSRGLYRTGTRRPIMRPTMVVHTQSRIQPQFHLGGFVREEIGIAVLMGGLTLVAAKPELLLPLLSLSSFTIVGLILWSDLASLRAWRASLGENASASKPWAT